ncbi:hypothetical protein BX070DRAFT_231001, partial [Coemansia spiralis]
MIASQDMWLLDDPSPMHIPQLPIPMLSEPLPPYTQFAEFQAPQDLGYDESPEVAQNTQEQLIEPTDLRVYQSSRMLEASQYIQPTSHMSILFEGLKSTKVSLCTDIENKYRGMAFIQTRFAYEPMGAPIKATSTVSEKDSRLTVKFEHDYGCQLTDNWGECTIIVPKIGLDSLTLRLSVDSHLEILHFDCGQTHVDVAVVEGSVSLDKVDASRIRIAIGSGCIHAQSIAFAESAQFVAMQGKISVCDCNGGSQDDTTTSIRVNAPAASVELSNVNAHNICVNSGASIALQDANATSIKVVGRSDAINLDNVFAASLDVQAETAPIRGSWTVTRALQIVAISSLIHGHLKISGNDPTSSFIKTCRFPVQLRVDKEFTGAFDLSAHNSVVRFGLATSHDVIFQNKLPGWIQGNIGAGRHSLTIQNINSPIVVSS